MMLRATFSLFLACLPLLMCGDVIKSSIAKKQIEIAEKQESANPYVTSGLMYMWDGEWNAGLKKHDPAAMTWKDIVKGVEIKFNSTPTFEDNKLVTRTGNFGKATIQDLNGLPWTVECVYRSMTNNKSYAAISVGYMCFGGSGRGAFYAPTYNRVCVCGNVLSMSSYINDTKMHYVAGSYNLQAFDRYIDGICVTSEGQPYAQNIKSINTVLIGCLYEVQYSGDGEIYCIRIYNRALAQDEIEKNYIVDKERFGL